MTDILGLNPVDYWTAERAVEYDSKNNIKKAQHRMSGDAIEILNFFDGTVLDVGCGTGFSTEVLNEYYYTVGLDISFEMVKLARKKDVKCICADFLKMPFKNSSFDGVVSISAIQWVLGRNYAETLDNYKSVARELSRVLRDKGIAVVQFYPQTREEFDLVSSVFGKFFVVEVIETGSGKKLKKYLKLIKKRK